MRIEDKEKEKIEKFDGEVIVLIPTPPTSNLYILNILAKISELICLIKDKNKDRDEKRKIQPQYHFLLLIDVMRDVERTREQLEKHYRYIIKDIEKNIDTLAQIRYHEFQSLVNNFIMSLEGLSDKEHREVLSNLEYIDIKDYVAEKKEIIISSTDSLHDHLKTFKDDKEKEKEEKEKAAFDTFFTPFAFEKSEERYPMGELLKILCKWKGKNKILVVMDGTRDFVMDFLERFPLWKEENVAIAAYPNPMEVFETESPPSFSNLLSRHINEGSDFDYKRHKKILYNMLDELNSGLFSTEDEEEKTLTEEEIKEIINEGFLTVQKSIIQQLSTII